MFNRERTKQVFGYDLDPNQRRRTNSDFKSTNGVFKKDLLVIDNCPTCNRERQVKLRQSRKNKPCPKCFHNSPEMLNIKHNQVKIVTDETKQKMVASHWSKRGDQSAFKGGHHTESAKQILADKQKRYMESLTPAQIRDRYIKSSCSLRGISEQDFDGWVSPETTRIRGSKEYKNWERSVLLRDTKCCFPMCLERRRVQLIAHHKDGFNWAIDKRFDVNNGVILCKQHHTDFHSKYGRGNNTKAEYDEWIALNKIPITRKRKLYLVTGAPGSGKSWVCGQLKDKFDYIPYDDVPKEQHLYLMLKDIDAPILYDPWRKATSFAKRYGEIFDVKFLVIVESQGTLKQRLEGRGGTFDHNSIKYCKRAQVISKKADFTGTSEEVLAYLKQTL